MKKYIAKNWMKLLRIGGYIALVLIALYKINAPKTLIADYIKYGKDVAPSTSSGVASGVGGAVSSIFGTTVEGLNGISPTLMPFFLVLLTGILGVVILHMIIDKKPDAKKKK